MATQIIMNLNGDTRHNFDAKDVKALLEAERRFKDLTWCWFYGGNSYQFRRTDRDAHV
jgi:hypothetical protein